VIVAAEINLEELEILSLASSLFQKKPT
jgi:hypothetical protein